MHELGIAMEVARIAREEAGALGAKRVVGLRLRVGAWSGVEPESLRFALETLTAEGSGDPDDLLRGARVELALMPAELRCPGCGEQYEAQDFLTACPQCGVVGGELAGGRELDLEEIEIEDGCAGYP